MLRRDVIQTQPTPDLARDAWAFDRDRAVALGAALRPGYEAALPYPHVVVDGLLGDERSAALARDFPSPSHAGWKRRDYAEQRARLGQLARTGFA
ncbi:MAG: 2OG-Fe(II) oxygenase, partial [Myxococcota bacterium]|nr:2OG-Fe(II) oxygenase [Myxococcota bacterium]